MAAKSKTRVKRNKQPQKRRGAVKTSASRSQGDTAVRKFSPKQGGVLVLERFFNAPRELVFRAWTDSKQLARWWGPAGFTNPVCEIDARPGGRIRIDMTAPDGTVFPMLGTFHEITPPRRLVFTSTAFHDEKGNAELEALNTVTFEEMRGKTRLTLRAEVVWATARVAGALSGMEQGWSQSLERLEALVSKA